MADIKRYDLEQLDYEYSDLMESATGEWVKYEDIAPAIKRAFEEGLQHGKEEEKVRAMVERWGKERY